MKPKFETRWNRFQRKVTPEMQEAVYNNTMKSLDKLYPYTSWYPSMVLEGKWELLNKHETAMWWALNLV